MRVAIVHYHLSPGGVSTVIRAASQALTNASIRHVILAGSSPSHDLPIRLVEGLRYSKVPGTLTAGRLLRDLREAAEDSLGGPPDLWHFHNHSLGKNALLPAVVHLLALANEPLILQIHDLAEDGRPQNYPLIADCQTLYPVSPRIGYAFINARDQNLFIAAGLPRENSTLLTNPAAAEKPAAPETTGPPLVLYPSRAIRRKNLGELLLLAALAPAGTRFAITRAPENPEALAIHDAWRAFAEKHQLPVDFQVVDRLAPTAGADRSFSSWLARATHLVTTSIAEGCGLVYRESFAFQKPLIGRNLANFTDDGTHHTGNRYDRILIPSDWIDAADLRAHLTAYLTETYLFYQRNLTPEIIEQTFVSLHHGPYLDFGNLPEPLQETVITRFLENPGTEILIQSGREKRPARTWLAYSLQGKFTAPPAPARREDLTALYTRLLLQPSSALDFLDPGKILDSCLSPENFHFLLTAPR